MISDPAPSRVRVAVTGLGAVTPLGLTIEESWERLVAGCSGIRAIDRFDATGLRTRVAGQVEGFDPGSYMAPRIARRIDRFIHLGVAASRMAVEAAKLEIGRSPERVAVVMGNCLAGVVTLEQGHSCLVSGEGHLSSYFVPGTIGSMASGFIAIELGARGPNVTTNEACASGTVALGAALELLRKGRADAVVAGGCEAGLCRLQFEGYGAMRATTTRNHDPAGSSRPFERDRDGFVPAEGAAALVLEPLDRARERGATVMAELAGYGTTCDAFHPTGPEPSGDGWVRCMRMALEDAGLGPEAVDAVSAHGTSTPVNGITETRALEALLGDRAARVPVTANKSMTGHTIGAAGAIEAAFSVLSLRDGIVPPTINYEHPDPECGLDYVPNEARRMEVDVVLSNSFGFGGVNASVVVRRP